jgi:hypothetical protein
MANPTFKPVELCLHPPGGYREIGTVIAAANALLNLWPQDKQRGPEFEEACLASMAAIEARGSAEYARKTLLMAAWAAGIMCRQQGYENGRETSKRPKR